MQKGHAKDCMFARQKGPVRETQRWSHVPDCETCIRGMQRFCVGHRRQPIRRAREGHAKEFVLVHGKRGRDWPGPGKRDPMRGLLAFTATAMSRPLWRRSRLLHMRCSKPCGKTLQTADALPARHDQNMGRHELPRGQG